MLVEIVGLKEEDDVWGKVFNAPKFLVKPLCLLFCNINKNVDCFMIFLGEEDNGQPDYVYQKKVVFTDYPVNKLVENY